MEVIEKMVPCEEKPKILLDDCCLEDESSTSNLLKAIFELHSVNHQKQKKEHRFSEYIKNVVTYMYIVGGRQCYELLPANLPGVCPSAATTLNHLHKSQIKIEQFTLNLKDLKKHSSRNAISQ